MTSFESLRESDRTKGCFKLNQVAAMFSEQSHLHPHYDKILNKVKFPVNKATYCAVINSFIATKKPKQASH